MLTVATSFGRQTKKTTRLLKLKNAYKRFVTLSMKYCHLIECLFLTTFRACRVGRKLTFAIIQYLKPKETRIQ